jgi:SAM-dependent methyltransferase
VRPEGEGAGNAGSWDRIAAGLTVPPPDAVGRIRFGPGVDDDTVRVLGDVAGRRVLDLGTGTGEAAVTFARRGATVVAVEPSAGRLALGRRLADREEVRVEWHRADLADLAFLRADSVDLAFSASALDEVRDVARLFRQVHRVLRPHAAFVFSHTHPLAWCTRVADAGTLDVDGGDDDGPPRVRRAYGDESPATVAVEGQYLTVWPRPLARVVTELHRAGFRVDVLVEPDTGGPVPEVAVWRARKEGV